jgi:hypothetical protein
MYITRITVLLAAFALAPAALSAQPATVGTELAGEVEPLQCWWRTSTPAVRIAEPFLLTLTCAITESDTRRVAVDQANLSPGAISVSPFEVIGGGEPAESRTGDRRFFQREYRLRVVIDGAFGRDVAIPPLLVTYRLQEGTGVRTQGIERRHQLPALPIHIVSMVPADARDIREPGAATFAELDEGAFRAATLTTAGSVFMALGTLGVVVAFARASRRRHATRSPAATLTDRLVLDHAARELEAVRQAREEGAWTADLIARALVALRVVASYVTSGAPSQRVLAAGEKAPDGVLVHVVPRRGRIAISSTVTPRVFERMRVRNDSDDANVPNRQQLTDMQSALAIFTGARYGRSEPEHTAPLDSALDSATRIVREMIKERAWAARTLALTTERVSQLSRMLWSR